LQTISFIRILIKLIVEYSIVKFKNNF